MLPHLGQILEQIQAAPSRDDLSLFIRKLRDFFNVEHIVYHAVNPSSGQYAALTYSADWVDHYVAQDYQRIDPVVLAALRHNHPFDWQHLDWSGRTAQRFLSEATAAGVGHMGFSVPIHGPCGRLAIMTLSDIRKDRDWGRLCDYNLLTAILTAHFINERAMALEERQRDDHPKPLSPRECDVLSLLATGKNRAQAADRLSISEHTCRGYVESARRKLGAQNTVHAVARALHDGKIVI